MIRGSNVLVWVLALGVSILAHGAIGLFVMEAVTPEPLVEAPPLSARIRMQTKEVQSQAATEKTTSGEETRAANAQGVTARQPGVRSQRAGSTPPPTQALASVPKPVGAPVPALQAQGPDLASALPAAAVLADQSAPVNRVDAQSASAPLLDAGAPAPTRAASAEVTAISAPARRAQTAAVVAGNIDAQFSTGVALAPARLLPNPRVQARPVAARPVAAQFSASVLPLETRLSPARAAQAMRIVARATDPLTGIGAVPVAALTTPARRPRTAAISARVTDAVFSVGVAPQTVVLAVARQTPAASVPARAPTGRISSSVAPQAALLAAARQPQAALISARATQADISLSAAPKPAVPAAARQAQAVPVPARAPASRISNSVTLKVAALDPAVQLDATQITSGAPRFAPVDASPLVMDASTPLTPDLQQTTSTPPPASLVAPAEPLSTQASAVLGWAGSAGENFDVVSLSAVQSFMRPLDARDQAGSARDSISDLLAEVPCSRLQAAFQPETGVLELRGHIPDRALQAPIVKALQAQLGASIPVTGNVQILPSPQCDVLAMVQDIGLPQSQGQKRDPLRVGATTQISTFEYREGERVIVRMMSPEFAAYVYVDFFDVNGQVLHLRPNKWEAVELHPPNSPLAIGGDRGGRSAVRLIVQPPFGQELVVAYASSLPLYEGLREPIEPAGPYLAWLRTRIAEVRAANLDYRGEWVYMFLQTRK
jgi:uncharacterized protein YneF (UPF0154 family)